MYGHVHGAAHAPRPRHDREARREQLLEDGGVHRLRLQLDQLEEISEGVRGDARAVARRGARR